MRGTLKVGDKKFTYYDLNEARKKYFPDFEKLPISLRILAENLYRFHQMGEESVSEEDLLALNDWAQTGKSSTEISFYPARVLMQDFTGVPAVVDLAALREGMKGLGGDPKKVNPLGPVDLVIDHSVTVDTYGQKDALEKNVKLEYERNIERYTFLKWGQNTFNNFRVVPPGTGICHQVNLEYLAKTVWQNPDLGEAGAPLVYPDTLVGTDSHTTMINGLAVLGWGVGGIEAEAAMLGRPISMLIPEVVGFKLKGLLPEGATATDLVLRVVEMLRQHGVVGKFVEFYGAGLAELPLADRATIANMAPEYGATCGFFPTDEKTLEYLKFSGRSEEEVRLVEVYSKDQGLWYSADNPIPSYSSSLELDLSSVTPCLAGPKRPQDRIELSNASATFIRLLPEEFGVEKSDLSSTYPVENADYKLGHGAVVIAAITSCTNTSNPSVMLAAGLVAKKARERGMKVPPWVKTSLAPGSQVVTDYLIEAGLQEDLDSLGFQLVGYGCTTCIGNSGPLREAISSTIHQHNLVVASVLSGNRNFEGRISPDVRANFLASPPLVVIYALAGSMNIDITRDAIAKDRDGKDVFFADLWPSNREIADTLTQNLSSAMFVRRYADVFKGDEMWQKIETASGDLYAWDEASTYIKNPPFFDELEKGSVSDFTLKKARILALLGDSVTTDHISPAGSISPKSPAGKYLSDRGVSLQDFNSYGARRGNHEVMMRGTFANIRIRNEMIDREGAYTRFIPTGEELPIYDAAMKYKEKSIPLVVIGGKEYGTGSSRDWAAKGTFLLGVKAVIAESFERIHRSNLIGMGVMPLQFLGGASRKTLKLDGSEQISLTISEGQTLAPKVKFEFIAERSDGSKVTAHLICRVDTKDEMKYFKNGGILQYVLRDLNARS